MRFSFTWLFSPPVIQLGTRFISQKSKAQGKKTRGVTVEQHVTNRTITYKLPLLCKLQYSHWGRGVAGVGLHDFTFNF